MFDGIISLIRSLYGADGKIALHEPRFDSYDKELVLHAIESTFVSSVGEYVNRFERELAEYLGVKHAVVTVNGSAALHVALRLAGVVAGSEVLTQALTFVATANAVAYNGAFPVFLDVDRDRMGLSPDRVSHFLEENAEQRENGVFNKKSERKIAALLPMHTFGLPCRIEEICDIGRQWGIPVIEDAAEALGSICGGCHCGSFGLMGVLSFNGNKIVTSGGGGAIVTDDDRLAHLAKHLTTTAKVPHRWAFEHDMIGYNYRMPNLNAALACAQLRHLPAYLDDKRELAAIYQRFFAESEWADFFEEGQECTSNYWLNAIVLEAASQRDRFLEETNSAGIMTRPIWKLMNELKMYAGCQCDDLNNSGWLRDRVVNLPSGVRKHE
jgi:perosamine synthetase